MTEPVEASALTPRKADLVLEGGGVKGIALVGALTVLERHGYTFPRIAGTSAGSIVGALAASGMTASEMADVMRRTDFATFQDASLVDRIPLVGKVLSVAFDQGVYEGEVFARWLAEVLPDGIRTFGDLRLAPDPSSTLAEDQRYRLVVMASDVSLRRIARFPWDFGDAYGLTADDQSVVDAVRASMSIPFFFEPAQLDHGAGRLDDDGRPLRSTLVDGGMLSNFPVEVFDRTDGRRPRWPTFGVKLSTRPGARVPAVPGGPLSLSVAMLRTMTSWYDGMHVDREDVVARTIFVDTTGVSSTDFDLTRSDQDMLFDRGQEAAEKFLASWDFDRWVTKFRKQPSMDLDAAAGPVPAARR